MNKRNQAILEMLAENEHATWSSWMLYLFEVSIKNEDGTVTIPKWAVDGWTKQANTGYSDLSEDEKESDRKEVRHIAHILTAQEVEEYETAIVEKWLDKYQEYFPEENPIGVGHIRGWVSLSRYERLKGKLSRMSPENKEKATREIEKLFTAQEEEHCKELEKSYIQYVKELEIKVATLKAEYEQYKAITAHEGEFLKIPIHKMNDGTPFVYVADVPTMLCNIPAPSKEGDNA